MGWLLARCPDLALEALPPPYCLDAAAAAGRILPANFRSGLVPRPAQVDPDGLTAGNAVGGGGGGGGGERREFGRCLRVLPTDRCEGFFVARFRRRAAA